MAVGLIHPAGFSASMAARGTLRLEIRLLVHFILRCGPDEAKAQEGADFAATAIAKLVGVTVGNHDIVTASASEIFQSERFRDWGLVHVPIEVVMQRAVPHD